MDDKHQTEIKAMAELSPSAKATSSTVNSEFPKSFIAANLIGTAAELFGFQWHPRVVRYQKASAIGMLQAVDYAVPCFELGKQLHLEPQKVAQMLHSHLKDDPKVADYFKTDAVNGYLNIQLTDQYLEQVLQETADWYQKPRFIGSKHGSDRLLILGSDITANGIITDTTYSAASYLLCLYELFEKEIAVEYLIGDHSGELIETLTDAVLSAQQKHLTEADADEKMSVRRAVKKLLLDVESKEPSEQTIHISEVIKGMRETWAKAHPYATDIILESSIVASVNGYLDSLPASMSDVVIRDEANRAIYFAKDESFIALRSVEGLLYASAYVLFVLSQLLSASHPDEKIIIAAPQKSHAVLSEFASLFEGNTRVICFDPQNSRADISQLQANDLPLKNCLIDVSDILLKGNLPALTSENRSRQLLFELIDVPVDLSQYLQTHQLPAIFDLLSSASRATLELRANHQVDIPTHQDRLNDLLVAEQ